jgi:hypothetical protein
MSRQITVAVYSRIYGSVLNGLLASTDYDNLLVDSANVTQLLDLADDISRETIVRYSRWIQKELGDLSPT